GEPISALTSLASPVLGSMVRELLELRQLDSACRNAASELLFEAVGRADHVVRQSLIRLRRAIFNAREVSEADWQSCTATLHLDEIDLLNRCKDIRKSLSELEREVSLVYHAEWRRVSDEIWSRSSTG